MNNQEKSFFEKKYEEHTKAKKQEFADQESSQTEVTQEPKRDEAKQEPSHLHLGCSHSRYDQPMLEKFNEEMSQDEELRKRFQDSPDTVLEERGIAVPEGYKASYDYQYVKAEDGSPAGLLSYRIGNINFTK